MLLIGLAVIAAEPATAAALPPRNPEERFSLVSLFTTDDYPADALAANEQGTTAVDLEISARGKVTRCTVTQSASPSLDARTCAIITTRAQYPLVRNKAGRAIATSDQARINWVLPEENSGRFADSWLEIRALVGGEGPSKCTIRGAFARAALSQAQCDRLVQTNATYRPAAIPLPYVLTIREEQLVGEGIAPLPSGTGLARVIIRKRISPEGRVTACELVPEPRADVDSSPSYPCLVNGEFPALPDEEKNRGDRLLTISYMRSFQPAVPSPK